MQSRMHGSSSQSRMRAGRSPLRRETDSGAGGFGVCFSFPERFWAVSVRRFRPWGVFIRDSDGGGEWRPGWLRLEG